MKMETTIYMGDLDRLEFRNIGNNVYSKPTIVFVKNKWNDKEFEFEEWKILSLVANIIFYLDALQNYNKKENKTISIRLHKIKQILKLV